ncbi:MAG: alpha/beta hydrolase, partial [Armatimonadetes bacterium]|nr:alpha/beta hydrolase [Armatimonadota bacterium]
MLLLLTLPTLLVAAGLAEPRELTFTAATDGSTQRYVELMPADYDPAQTRDLLLAFHGHGSDRWQYVREERGECRGARD